MECLCSRTADFSDKTQQAEENRPAPPVNEASCSVCKSTAYSGAQFWGVLIQKGLLIEQEQTLTAARLIASCEVPPNQKADLKPSLLARSHIRIRMQDLSGTGLLLSSCYTIPSPPSRFCHGPTMAYNRHMYGDQYPPPLPLPGYGSAGYPSGHAYRPRTPPPICHLVRPTIPHPHCYAHGYSSRDGYHSHSKRHRGDRHRHHPAGYLPGPYPSDRYGMPPMYGHGGYDPAYPPTVDPFLQQQYHDAWRSPWKHCY